MMKRLNCVAGIDPSLTSLGLVFLARDGTHEAETIKSKPRGRDLVSRIARYNDHVYEVMERIEAVGPNVIVMEGYAFASSGNAVITLGEFGGLLRADLLATSSVVVQPKVIEVSPPSLKKFATGKGNCGKELVVASVVKRWGVVLGNNDEYDAYVCAKIAAILAGYAEPETKIQAAVIETITGEPSKCSETET